MQQERPWESLETLAGAVLETAEPVQMLDSDFPAELKSPGQAQASIEKLIFRILQEAVLARASDIHLEPKERHLSLRYRIDGVLHLGPILDAACHEALMTRLKLMAGMQLAERRLPQEGRFSSVCLGKRLDLRVASLPSLFGEAMTLRVLEQDQALLNLDELGLLPDFLAIFKQWIEQADGLILVTGPTGSGKSTTLYSALNYLSKAQRKIISLEDPVERILPGVNQVALRPDLGFTLVEAMRAVLRQAPNVIMLGEIRDTQSAQWALHMALTGHLVLSTVHSYDSIAACARLLDLGLKASLLASALRGILAQRLVRRVCAHCKKKSLSCELCRSSGYKGRVGIFECLSITETIQSQIAAMKSQMSTQALRQKCFQQGLMSLREDGLKKVALGWIDKKELFSEIGTYEGPLNR